MSDPIERQFEAFTADETQHFDIEMLPEERSATKAALRDAVDLGATSPAVCNAIIQILLSVSRTYEADLHDTRFEMSVEQRNDQDQWTRGVIAGFARARDYITNPHYAAELYKRIDPENKEM